MDPTDPRSPDFDLASWEARLLADRRARAEAQRRRDREWRQELATRHGLKGGPSTAPSYVSVPVPDPLPGEPLFRLVRQG